MKTISLDGVEYLAGSEGSMIWACPKCGGEIFQDAADHVPREKGGRGFQTPKCWGRGWGRGDAAPCGTTMERIRMDELETRWKPFWRGLGWWVRGEPLSESPWP